MPIDDIQAVCFDAFGTLCRIRDLRDPYGRLFSSLGLDPHRSVRQVMTTHANFMLLAMKLGDISAAEPLLADLDAELSSIELYDGAADALRRLSRAGYPLWIVSNLAYEYGRPLRSLTQGLVQGYSLSYEVRAAKPEQLIYAHAANGLGLSPDRILMVGDTRDTDVDGAARAGMNAVLLQRAEATRWPSQVASLSELADHLIA